jgi:cytochrome bd-type quinol oxidase subunit 2
VPEAEREGLERPVARAASIAVLAGYALWLAATTPFSSPANILTAIAIVAVVVMAIIRWPARPTRVMIAEEERPRHPYLGWVVLVGLIVAWELVMYLVRGSRSAHPTLSSMADAFDRYNYGLKALACFAWLWLGTAIVRAGTQTSSRAADRGAVSS